MREPTKQEKVVRFVIVLVAVAALLYYFLVHVLGLSIFIVPGWRASAW